MWGTSRPPCTPASWPPALDLFWFLLRFSMLNDCFHIARPAACFRSFQHNHRVIISWRASLVLNRMLNN
jgi:hypothetical protein